MSSSRCIRRTAIVNRIYSERSATTKEKGIRNVQNIGRGTLLRERRQALGHRADGRVATDVASMQTDLPGAGGHAD